MEPYKIVYCVNGRVTEFYTDLNPVEDALPMIQSVLGPGTFQLVMIRPHLQKLFKHNQRAYWSLANG